MQLLSTLNSLDNVADGSTRKLLKTATSSGSGNAVTAVSISGDTLTYTLGSSFSLSNHTHDVASTSAAGFMSAADKIKLNATSGYYGTCSTAKGTAAKVVDCSNYVLATGAVIYVKFTNANDYNGTATLNVNGTGAKDIARVGTTKTSRYYWTAGELVGFVYDGTNYLMIDKGTATTTYYGLTKLTTTATSTSDTLALTPKALNSFAQNMIANYAVYSSSSTYNVGDRVRYSYNTYECITAITTAEAWTAAHWKALDPLQTQIDEKSEVSISRNLTSGEKIGTITIDGTATDLYAPATGSVNTSLASPQQTYYLTGVQTTAAGQGNLYNSYLSSTYTGIKYVTSTSQEGGSLYVDDREVVTGLYYEIS